MKVLVIFLVLIGFSLFSQTFAQSEIDEEFHKGVVKWEYRCYVPTEQATVMVIDDDMNQDSTKAERFEIQVWSDFDERDVYSGIVRDIMVVETGASTGVFEGIVFFGSAWDDAIGHRIPAGNDNVIFAKYVDHTTNESTDVEIIGTTFGRNLPIGGTWDDWKRVEQRAASVVYDPCLKRHVDTTKMDIPSENDLQIMYPTPSKQLDSGLTLDEIQCKDGLVLLQKYDGNPACVTESTKQKLIERGWTTKDSGMKCDNKEDFDLIRYSEYDDIYPQRLVAFVKEGTTGVICLQYISNLDNEGFFDIDENLHQRNSSDKISSNVVLNAIPDKVSREYGTDVTVAYQIHAKNNSTGIYWINLSQLCDSLPVVVWDDEPRISEADIPVRTGVKHCPAKFLEANIIGYSGLDLQYHSAKPT